ncbi:MAG: RNA polymerase sigma factor (sigma-70 family) [Cyclobacteriaceae bacterium]|jgi:RNA polymerase sigma factor (sigma-70 family)
MLDTNLTDEQIIECLKTGETSRYFEVLYDRYRQRVYEKCMGFVKDRRTAEELLEDIFSKVFEKIPSFQQKSSFSTWLYTIVYNHCIDYLRLKKKLHYPNWDSMQDMAEIVDNVELENDISIENMLNIMELVHPEEKALLNMKYMDNLSLKQIGQALRISESATKMRLKRARTRFLLLFKQKYLNK